MVYELERVLRVCDGFFCSMSTTYDGAVLMQQYCAIITATVGVEKYNDENKTKRVGNI